MDTTAAVITANVVRRLIHNQPDEYAKARTILDACQLSEQAAVIVRDELAIVVALHAVVYDQNGQLRRDDQGLPLERNYVESRILNLKANPHREPPALLLRGIFMDLRAKMGNEYRRYCRELFRRLRGDEKPSGQQQANATATDLGPISARPARSDEIEAQGGNG
jgi:hypothetical protein